MLRVLLAHWTWIILANKDFWKSVVNAGVWPRFSDYGCKIAVLWKHAEVSLHFRRKDCGKNRKLFWQHILVFFQIRKRSFMWLNIQRFLLLRLFSIASSLSLRIFLIYRFRINKIRTLYVTGGKCAQNIRFWGFLKRKRQNKFNLNFDILPFVWTDRIFH